MKLYWKDAGITGIRMFLGIFILSFGFLFAIWNFDYGVVFMLIRISILIGILGFFIGLLIPREEKPKEKKK